MATQMCRWVCLVLGLMRPVCGGSGDAAPQRAPAHEVSPYRAFRTASWCCFGGSPTELCVRAGSVCGFTIIECVVLCC